MNIITTTYNSNFFYIRPDISLNRDSNDYFCPEEIQELTVAPFLYIRMEKAGKAVQAKFAQRYYSSIGYGLNITGKSLIDSKCPMSFLMANALDNSTIVSPLHAIEELPLEKLKGSHFTANCQDGTIDDIINIFNKKIEHISALTSFKTGDYIAIEVAEHQKIEIGNNIIFGDLAFQIR